VAEQEYIFPLLFDFYRVWSLSCNLGILPNQFIYSIVLPCFRDRHNIATKRDKILCIFMIVLAVFSNAVAIYSDAYALIKRNPSHSEWSAWLFKVGEWTQMRPFFQCKRPSGRRILFGLKLENASPSTICK
jgi:hypothetical protein